MLRPSRGESEFARLVEVWRSAVDATHGFLDPADRDALESRLPSEYFPAVELTVAEEHGRVVGFAGTHGESLDMLFVDASARGQGIGSALLEHVVRGHGVTRVDVNEQNSDALGFYRARGFRIVGRSDRDADGRPYPLLHLERDPEPDLEIPVDPSDATRCESCE